MATGALGSLDKAFLPSLPDTREFIVVKNGMVDVCLKHIFSRSLYSLLKMDKA